VAEESAPVVHHHHRLITHRDPYWAHWHALTPDQKDALALQRAEASEARRSTVEARRLRRLGISSDGLNLSQMEQVEAAARHSGD
jgi:hypothetical protein